MKLGAMARKPLDPTTKPLYSLQTMNLPQCVPIGAISDLQNRPDADRIAICPGRGAFDDYRVKRYASRSALEAFLRNPGGWRALVKNPVPRSMLVHPAFQREA